MKIAALKDHLSSAGIKALKKQILAQGDAPVVKEPRIKRNNKEVLAIRFSEPLISESGHILLIKEQADEKYCFTTTISVFRKNGSSWAKDFELFKRQLCE